MSSSAHLTGHCLCGGVRIEIDEPLVSSRYCHCTRCQRRTGTAASAGAAVVPGSLRIVAGEELVKTYWPSGGGYGKAFCIECGSHLFSQSPDDPDAKSVRLGVIDGDPGIRPSARQHVASAAVWEEIPDDDLRRFEGSQPG
jgi:hypothetical protein